MERGNLKSALYLTKYVFETDASQNLTQGYLGAGTVTVRVVTPI